MQKYDGSTEDRKKVIGKNGPSRRNSIKKKKDHETCKRRTYLRT